MKKFNKNIWTIFYILVFLSTISFAYLVNDKRNELINDLKRDQSDLTQLFNNEVTVYFSQFDSVLDLLARHYANSRKLDTFPIETLLKKNPMLSNIYLFSATGKYLTSTSTDHDIHTLEKNAKSPLFSDVLKTDHMLIGQPVFSPEKDDWIIPVKKRILDKNSNVIAVIDAHISASSFSKAWVNNFSSLMLEIISNGDFLLILNANSIPEKNIESNKEKFNFKKLKTSLEEHKTKLNSLNSDYSKTFFPSFENDAKHSVAFIYNQQFDLWIRTIYATENINSKLTKIAVSYLLVYFYILLVFWGAFKWVIILSNKAYLNLIYTSEHNRLTGLYNRKVLSSHILNKQETQQSFTLLYLNLINFKKINDTFGYQYGDTILKEVAQRITQSFAEKKGLVTHFSGDDFVILMETTDNKIITTYLNELLTLINMPYRNLYNSFSISASIGVVPVNKDVDYLHHATLDKLINYSEKVMLIAKDSPLKYTFFSALIYEEIRSTIRHEEALTGAIANNELSLVYQPQLNREGKIIGVEALARWCSPQLGNVSPEIFIPIAEELNLMPLIGQFVIENALDEITRLQIKLDFSCALSVNVSAQQFLQQNFLSSLLASYQSRQSPCLDFILEITENIFIENLDQLSSIFNTLKEYDIGLSLDDFGTGFSSLSMLKVLPVDELKIDKSFVDHIVSDKVDKKILEQIIEMGKVLNLRIVAEGVETKEQLAILKSMECDVLQGYFHSKPLKIDELASFIKNNLAEYNAAKNDRITNVEQVTD